MSKARMRLTISEQTSYLVPFRSYRRFFFKFGHFAFLSGTFGGTQGQRTLLILGSLESTQHLLTNADNYHSSAH